MGAGDPRYVVTGPSGWIGQAFLAYLAEMFGHALPDRVAAFGSHRREIELASGQRLPVRALDTIAPADVEGAHVVHLSYLTKEKSDALGEPAFTRGNRAIDDAVLGAIERGRPRSLFIASSGAAALAEDGRDRHPYGLSKLDQEARFLAAAARIGVPAIAGRIFNLSGPHINKRGSYAIADFIDQALEARTIRIAAPMPVFRSFLHVTDLARLIVAAGAQGVGRAAPIDLCGAEIVEMDDLAAAVARAVGGPNAIERGPVDLARPSVYLGDFTDTRILAMELGVSLRPFAVQVGDTLAWIARERAAPASGSC